MSAINCVRKYPKLDVLETLSKRSSENIDVETEIDQNMLSVNLK